MQRCQFYILCIAFTLISLNYSFVSPQTRNTKLEKAKALIQFKPQISYLTFYELWSNFFHQIAWKFAQFVRNLTKYACNLKGPPPIAVSPSMVTTTSTTSKPKPIMQLPSAPILQTKYMIVEDKMNWMESHINCLLDGYNLTSVKDSEEFNLLQTVIANSELPMIDFFWTAGNDLFREGNFTWISNGENFTDFFPPGNIEPTGLPTEHCVFLYFNATFNLHIMADYPCKFKAASICKKSGYA